MTGDAIIRGARMRTELQAAPQADFAAAERYCARLTRRHEENFPVASWLVPKGIRPAMRAVYAFARTADDIADEPAPREEKLRRLDAWEGMLRRAFEGDAEHPVFVALRAVQRKDPLPPGPFLDLLAAFRRDAVETRYQDKAALLDYCRLSANPVGRLVLHLFGRHETALLPLSDALCTALQLANHWQDVRQDAERGRIYLPSEALSRHGVREAALVGPAATPEMQGLMKDMVAWARGFFDASRALPERVDGRLRYELRLTWEGGRRVLERIAAADYDVWRLRPRLGLFDAALVAARSTRGRG